MVRNNVLKITCFVVLYQVVWPIGPKSPDHLFRRPTSGAALWPCTGSLAATPQQTPRVRTVQVVRRRIAPVC